MLENVADIVRMELRHRYRAFRKESGRFLLLGVLALLLIPMILALVALAYYTGSGVTGGEQDAVDRVRSAVGGAFVAASVFVLFRALNGQVGLTAGDSVLLAASHRESVVAMLLVEAGLTGAPIGVLVLAAAVAFGAGTGSAVTTVLAAVAAVMTVAFGAVLGVTTALAGQVAVKRVRLLARLKTPLILVGSVAYLVGVVVLTDAEGGLYDPVFDAAAATPVGWASDLLLIGLVEAADPLQAGGFVLLGVVGTTGLAAASERLTTRLWYTTSVDTQRSTVGSWVPSVPLSTPRVGAIARKTWLRAVRSPIRLIYVVYAGLTAAFPLVQAVQGNGAPSLIVVVAVSGAWAAGAAFTLNPIGEASAVLPLTLTTTASGTDIVRGRWLASLLPGVPVTVAMTVAFALLTGFSPVDAAVFTLLAAALTALAPGIGLWVGAQFPSHETTEVVGSYEITRPSMFAFAFYTLALSVATIPAWLTPPGTVRDAVADSLGTDPIALSIAGALLAVTVVGGLALIGARRAGRAIGTHTLA